MLFRSNDTATTEIYTTEDTLSLHDALPISRALGEPYRAVSSERDGRGTAAGVREAEFHEPEAGIRLLPRHAVNAERDGRDTAR